jgi:hypothetical protein
VDELLAEVAAGRLDPIYVLHSEHPILIERVVTALRDAVVPPAARGFNTTSSRASRPGRGSSRWRRRSR